MYLNRNLQLTWCNILLLVILGGCSSASASASVSTPQPETTPSFPETQAQNDNAPTNSPQPEATPIPLLTQNQAYGKVLWDLYLQGLLPDGYKLYHAGTEHAKDNSFAILDVDGDGKEELILLWTESAVADMVEIVFGYNDGMIIEEIYEFPDMTYYDNGVIEDGWSHNQGMAHEFWPFDVHIYDAEKDIYLPYGAADAWEKSYREVDYNGNPFPDDIDRDGDGVIYFLYHFSPDGDGRRLYNNEQTVDGDEYESWRQSYLDQAERITVSFQQLTEENIAALGYPKPDIPIQTSED